MNDKSIDSQSKADRPALGRAVMPDQVLDNQMQQFLLMPQAEKDKIIAKSALDPVINAATTIQRASNTFGEPNFAELIDELKRQASQVNSGHSQRSEAMLIAHAHTLDILFNELVQRSLNVGLNLSVADQIMRLALKTQSQCRTTLETLSEIKYPRSFAFVGQANIAQNQQVNNGQNDSRAGGNKNVPNKLLETDHGQRLDNGATGKAGAADQQLEAVGAIHGAEDSGR